MSEPRIFTASGKDNRRTLLMGERGAPPALLAEFTDEDVADSYNALFDWLYALGESLTEPSGPTLSAEDLGRVGEEAFSWCDRMAGKLVY